MPFDPAEFDGYLFEGLAMIAAAAITATATIWSVHRTRRLQASVSDVQQKVDGIQANVSNSHETNLRDELDGRHLEVMEKIDGVIETQARQERSISRLAGGVTEIQKDIGGIREDVRDLHGDDAQIRSDQADLGRRVGEIERRQRRPR